jgi:hypothetical protein
MDSISFRCTSCKQGLKVKAEKAGRKVKCIKCGTVLTIPAASTAGSAPGSKAAAAPSPSTSPAKRPWDDEDEDSGGVYGLEDAQEIAAKKEEEAREAARVKRLRDEDEEDDEEEKEEEDGETQAEKDEALRRRLMGLAEGEEDEEENEEEEDEEDRPRRRRQPKVKLDPAAWQKVRVGIYLIVFSVGLLALAFLLCELVILIGLFAGPEYPEVVAAIHPNYKSPPEYEKGLDTARLVAALIGGLDNVTMSLVLLRIGPWPRAP